MSYRIESSIKLTSDWLPKTAFTDHYENSSEAVAIAIEGVDNPAEDEVRVVEVESGKVIWSSLEEEYE